MEEEEDQDEFIPPAGLEQKIQKKPLPKKKAAKNKKKVITLQAFLLTSPTFMS